MTQMVSCSILRSFAYSLDGRKSLQAVAGGHADIPADLVPGLEREGYVKPAVAGKGIAAAPENKMIGGAPENKAGLVVEDGTGVPGANSYLSVDDMNRRALRVEYEAVVGKRPFPGWTADELTTRIAEARGK